MNEIYEVADTLENFFVPTMKLKYKVKDERGRTVRKVYEKAKTPYQRLLESPDVSETVKAQLKETYESLSLVKLKRRLDALLYKLFSKKLGLNERRFHGQNYDLTRSQFHGQHILI